MREIRFRAYHTEQKRMFEVYGIGHDFITENTLDGVDPGTNAFCGDNLNFIKVMQFTGATTKNGEHIYEHDIVEVQGTKRAGLYKTIVVFKNYGFMLAENKTYLTNSACLLAVKTVLGNVFQNPELLEKGEVQP